MERNKKIIKSILVFAVVFLIIGYGFLFFVRLDNPVVINQYKDLQVSMNENGVGVIEWYMSYITNKNDTRRIDSMEFPEYSNLIGKPIERSTYINPYDIIGQYRVDEIRVKIVVYSDDLDRNDLSFSQIKMIFKDGSYFTDEIGEISVQKKLDKDDISGLEVSLNSNDNISYNIRKNYQMASFKELYNYIQSKGDK